MLNFELSRVTRPSRSKLKFPHSAAACVPASLSFLHRSWNAGLASPAFDYEKEVSAQLWTSLSRRWLLVLDFFFEIEVQVYKYKFEEYYIVIHSF